MVGHLSFFSVITVERNNIAMANVVRTPDPDKISWPHYTSALGVREHTAELASLALSDVGPIHSSTPPRILSSSHPNPTLEYGHFDGASTRAPNRPSPSTRSPGVIVEVTEPTSPDGKPTKCVGKSYLTHLLRNSPLETYSGAGLEPRQDASFHDPSPSPLALSGRDLSDPASEETSLLTKSHPDGGRHTSYDSTSQPNGNVESHRKPSLLPKVDVIRAISWPTEKGLNAVKSILHRKVWSTRDIWQLGVVEPAGYIPAVLLGLLLNILDGLSYGK
jgi:SulP family sulfate permease